MSGSDNNVYISKLILDLANTSHDIRESAAINLIEIGEEVTQHLIDALQHENWRVRQYAAWGLGQLADPRALNPLIARLNDSSEAVQEKVAAALGELDDKSAVEPIIHILQSALPTVQIAAAEALGLLNDKRAVPALVDALRHEDAL